MAGARAWLVFTLCLAMGWDATGFIASNLFTTTTWKLEGGSKGVESCTSRRLAGIPLMPRMTASADADAPNTPKPDKPASEFWRDFRKPLSEYRYSRFSGYLKAFRQDPAGLLLAFSEDLEKKGQPAVSLDFGM